MNIIVITIAFASAFIHVFAAAMCDTAFDTILLTPSIIYKNTELNVFGAGFVYFIYCSFAPIFAFLGFFNWLIHVGRK